MPAETPGAARPRSRAHRWLLLLPFAWQVALVPLVDDLALRPLGLPFPMAWQMLGIVFTTLVIGVVFAIDRRIDAAQGPEPEIAAALATRAEAQRPGSPAGH
ncbi:MAG: DUF3311 domain-containing protein [Steroidobacteraceae bacterium]|jgi:hypothetical protein|nr:DUF3311 domain-containing protein [Steroidobacteraceae bacterium]